MRTKSIQPNISINFTLRNRCDIVLESHEFSTHGNILCIVRQHSWYFLFTYPIYVGTQLGIVMRKH